MSTTSSKNFTTLYSGSGSVTPQAPYGNANVVGLLSVGTDGANTVANISATGNVSASYFLGNGSQLSGLPATYGNANVAAFLPTYTGNISANTISASGNIVTAGFFVGNFQGNITGNLTVPGLNTQVLYNNSGNAGASSDFTFNDATNVLSVNGNVVAANYSGSGADLSAITGANVTGVVAQATQAATANVANSVAGANVTGVVAQATQAATANVALVANSVAGANVTGVVAQATQAATANVANSVAGANVTGVVAQATQANAANTAATVTGAAQANITSVGTLTSLSASGNITSSGNISGNFILGNGSQLTGLPATYGNANVAAYLPTYTGAMPAMTGNVTTTANIQGAYLIGDGSFITNLPGGSYGNANVAAYLPTFTGNLGNTTAGTLFVGSATGNSRLTLGTTGDWYLIGTSDALISSGQTEITLGTGDSVNGNIKFTTQKTGNVFTWDFDGSGNLTLPPNVATPVIRAGNAVLRLDNASGNITAGNIVVNASQINTVAQQGVVIPTTAISNARIVIGNGWQGNISTAFDSPAGARIRNSRAAVWDYGTTGNSATQTELAVLNSLEITSNIANVSSRINAATVVLQMGGGSAANVVTTNNSLATVAAQNTFVIGTSGNAAVGNTTIAQPIATGSLVTAGAGGNATSAVAHQSSLLSLGGTIANAVMYSAQALRTTGTAVATNTAIYYVPPVVGNSLVGGTIGAGFRTGNTYYGLRVDDDLAQAKLGSLRQYHEFEYQIPTTSGNVVIDKTNGQVQVLTPTGNITITDYTNFVSTAYVDGVVAEPFQADTVTIVVNQGTTGGFNITLPTSNVTVGQTLYAGGIKTVSNVANSVTLISVTNSRLYATGTQPAGRSDSVFLTTVSPAFTVA